MANIKSAKKAVRQNKVRRLKNLRRMSSVKTACKKVMISLEDNDVDSAVKFLVDAESQIARAKGKGLFKKNTASRKISRLSKKVAAAKTKKA